MNIAAPTMTDRLEHSNGMNGDIISTIHKNFKIAVEQTKPIAEEFRGPTFRDTLFNIWSYLREDIHYKKDPHGKQYVRLPSRLLFDKTGDCKSYSLFGAAILYNLGYPVAFRYTSYGISPIPTHVYVITRDKNKKGWILDGVYKHFAKQKKYNYKQDYRIKILPNGGIYTKRH